VPVAPLPVPSSLPGGSRSTSSALSASPGGSTPARTAAPPILTRNEKLKVQVMRVQIKLQSLGLYEGRIDGRRNLQTIDALKHFQAVKGLPEDGMMTTPTLNALGVPAAN